MYSLQRIELFMYDYNAYTLSVHQTTPLCPLHEKKKPNLMSG
jgi:hypothetical protein